MNKKKNSHQDPPPKRMPTTKREESSDAKKWAHQPHQQLSISQSISSSSLKTLKQFIATIMDENRQLHQTCDQLRTQITLLKIKLDAKQLEIRNITRLGNNTSSFKIKQHMGENRQRSVIRTKTNSEPKKTKFQLHQDEESFIETKKEIFNFSQQLDKDEIDFSFSPSKPMSIKLYQSSLPIHPYLKNNPDIMHSVLTTKNQSQMNWENIDGTSGLQSKMIKGRIQKLVSEYRLEKSLKCMDISK